MRILFCNRDPSLMDGGDTGKIRWYWDLLEKKGHTLGYAHNVSNLDFSDYDVFHIFHLGHEFSYKFHLEARRTNKPTVISPIYFPSQHNPKEYRIEMLDYASAILYLSEGEQERVEQLFDKPRTQERSYIIPNGINPVFGEAGKKYVHPNRPDEEYVLCVGRLDERKNQHRLAQACYDLDIPLLLVGDPIQGIVSKTCQAIANKWSGLWWEGPHGHEMLAETYRGAKVLACPSTLEMWPNVVAEGGLAGCNLVVSEESMTFSDIDGVFSCKPKITSIRNAVEAAYNAPKDGRLVDYFKQFTWEDTVDKIEEVYKNVV